MTPGKQLINNIIVLLRPRQWSKNLLVFAGLIFSATFFEPLMVWYAFLGFAVFCLFSSCTYIINDILDREEDRSHPVKKKRPIASGSLTVRQALLVLFPLLFIALGVARHINTMFFLSGATYFLLTVSYSLWLKHIVIMDVFAIAFGFLIRAMAGALALEVEISPWFLICTLLLSLFLALAKRRQESARRCEDSTGRRRVLDHYPLSYLDQLISIVTASTIIAYSLYTFTAGKSELFMLTIPFVVYGIFRYLYLVYKQDLGESPEEVLLRDKPMIINILAWVLLSILILSLNKGG